jgi:putative Mn2+ efflux pump MntP
MSITELFLVAIGLSMDAFAIAVCHGLSMRNASCRKALIVGLYFGLFQAVMPLMGYLVGSQFSDMIVSFDHWIAFALLAFIGGKMIIGSFKKEGSPDKACPVETCMGGKRPYIGEASLKPAKMLPLALATSIDAPAAGVSFAFLRKGIVLICEASHNRCTLKQIGMDFAYQPMC